MVNDSVSDFLARLNNAALVGRPSLELPYSCQVERVAQVFKDSNYLKAVKKFKSAKSERLHLDINYNEEGRPLFNRILRVSKPGRRVYRNRKGLKRFLKEGLTVVSTSRGVISARSAFEKSLGGEIICEVK